MTGRLLVAVWLIASLGCVRRTPGVAPAERLRLEPSMLALEPVYRTAPSLRGKVVLVDFFATWCFPCIAELPLLDRLQRENEAQGFTVVAVGMDLEGRRVLDPFAESYQPPYPIVLADDSIRAGQSRFGPIAALPTYFLFDRDGELLVAYQGLADPSKLLEVVRRAVTR